MKKVRIYKPQSYYGIRIVGSINHLDPKKINKMIPQLITVSCPDMDIKEFYYWHNYDDRNLHFNPGCPYIDMIELTMPKELNVCVSNLLDKR